MGHLLGIRAIPPRDFLPLLVATKTCDWSMLAQPAHPTHELRNVSEPNAIAFSPDGQVLAVGCFDGTLVAWDVRSGQKLWDQPTQHDTIVRAIVFTSDGTLIATGSNDTTARVWRTRTGEPVGEIMKHGGAVSSVSFLENDRALLTGSYDNAIRAWDFRTGRLLSTPLRHQGSVEKVAVSPDHRLIASASDDFTARIWKLDRQLMDQTVRCRAAIFPVKRPSP